ncbi:hypothetical protein AB0C10_21455 [Microbispora amethystogenes]|uniref:hypothetical protein n=1 Tax=Microbispora amethystogenes TaxID=1427754 RepID=UPI0033F18EBE
MAATALTLPIRLSVGTMGETEVGTLDVPMHFEPGQDDEGKPVLNGRIDSAEFRHALVVALRSVADQIQSEPPPGDVAALAEKVREVRDIQGRPGNWDYSPYMHGMFNGLELAVSILEGEREPDYRNDPEGGYRGDRATRPRLGQPAPDQQVTAIGTTDCRTPDGVTVGLVDGIIATARVLRERDLTSPAVREALRDLAEDEDVSSLLSGP